MECHFPNRHRHFWVPYESSGGLIALGEHEEPPWPTRFYAQAFGKVAAEHIAEYGEGANQKNMAFVWRWIWGPFCWLPFK